MWICLVGFVLSTTMWYGQARKRTTHERSLSVAVSLPRRVGAGGTPKNAECAQLSEFAFFAPATVVSGLHSDPQRGNHRQGTWSLLT